MASSLASLVVDLQLQVASFNKNVGRANKELGSFHETVGKISKSLDLLGIHMAARFAVDAGKRFAEFAMHGAEVADTMGRLAQQTGLPVEEFSRLGYAAKLSEISTEDFASALGKLNVNIAEAASGGQKQVALFRALGVSVKDASGATRASSDILKDLASKFAGLKDDADKSYLAIELFGKAGAAMIPFLNEGKDGLAALSAEADRFGVTLDEKTSLAANEFGDNLDRIKAAVEGVSVRVAAQLAPAMADLTGQLLKSKGFSDALEVSVQALAMTLRLFAAGAILAAAELQKLQNVGYTLGAVTASLSKGDLAGAMKNVGLGMQAADNIAAAATKSIASLFAETEKVMQLPVMDFSKRAAHSIVRDQKSIQEALQNTQKEQNKLVVLWEHWVKLEEKRQASQFKLAGQVSSINAAAAQQRRDFANIGADPTDVLMQATTGFEDFNDALNQSVNAAYDRDEKLAEASDLEAEERFGAARAAYTQADIFDRLSKKAAGAAGAFGDLQKIADAEMKKTVAAIGSLALSFVSKLGELGQVVQAGVQGFQAGGVWGAFAAVIIEVASRFEGFSAVVDLANKVLGDFISSMAPALGALMGGLQGLLNGISGLLQSIGGTLQPAIRGIADGLMTIGKLLESLSGIFASVGAVGGIIDSFLAILMVLNPLEIVIKLLGASFRLVGIGMSYLSVAIMKIMGGILEKIRELLATLGLNDLALTISKMAMSMNSKAEALKTSADAEWTKLGHLFDTTPVDAVGTIDRQGVQRGRFLADVVDGAADSIKKLGDTADDVTDQLTNVPSGYKTATARFLSSFAESASLSFGQIVRTVEDAMERKSFTATGSSHGWKNSGPGGR